MAGGAETAVERVTRYVAGRVATTRARTTTRAAMARPIFFSMRGLRARGRNSSGVTQEESSHLEKHEGPRELGCELPRASVRDQRRLRGRARTAPRFARSAF